MFVLDDTKEPFDKQKLKTSIISAASAKRRICTTDDVDNLVNRIEVQLKGMEGTDIQSTVIGELVLKELKDIDHVAYIRFASIYKDFSSVSEFVELLNKLS